jgi:transcriptional regulator with XRE-family HTH domain
MEIILSIKSPDRVDMEVGQRIRVLRTAAGISQSALAGELGVTFQQVQKYEKGINRVGVGRLTRIAAVLNVPVSRLLGVEESPEATTRVHAGTASPLQLLTAPGALRLLRAYVRLEDPVIRRSMISVTESLARAAVRAARQGRE